MIDKPNPRQIMKGLKDFQKKTVDYVFSRLYQDNSTTDRFLIADEVGLGKTLEARGVIARTLDKLWDKRERIDVIYVCANSDIARQNINRLNVTGEQEFSFATRITLLPLEIHNLKQNRLNFISFTPGTSFDLKSRGGRAKERILLYHILREGWGFGSTAGPKNLFQVGVKERTSWRNRLKNFDFEQVDDGLKKAFLKQLAKRKGFKKRMQKLSDSYSYYRKNKNIPREERIRRNKFIGDLRQLLAETCISELEPDLVILDEFQRFKYLLDGDDEITAIAHTLFNYERAKILLLSATPYKMYTMYHEHHEDDHYQDLIRTVKFLFNDEQATEEFKQELKKYRRELFNLNIGGSAKLKEIQNKIEKKLRLVMVRNERIDVSRDHNAMLVEAESESAALTTRELKSFRMVDRVADLLDVRNAVSYWKSAPYLLNFMEQGYKLKDKLNEELDNQVLSADIKKAIEKSEGSLLEWEDIYNYRRVASENAKMKSLVTKNVDDGAWQLLWIAPSAPYYKVREGPYSKNELQNFSKALIFSSWRVVPRAVATLCSYKAERKMINSYEDKNIAKKNYRDLWDERVQLLRFAQKEGEPENMSNFTLLYPALTISQKIDPLEIESQLHKEDPPGKEEVFARICRKISELIKPVIEENTVNMGQSSGRDERWYWAALVLLDKKYNFEALESWFKDTGGGESWSDMISDQRDSFDGVFKKHIDLLYSCFMGEDLQLGNPPADLIEVLAKITLASPALSALRAYGRLKKKKEETNFSMLLTEAARTAINFRSLFNLPDSSYMIRGLSFTEDSRYWEGVLDYCINGNLQAVMDEYVHILRETNGLTNKKFSYALEQISGEIENSLRIRSASLKFDEIKTNPELKLKSRNIRCRYAMQFGDSSNEAGKRTRAGQVREAFNSPFKPFILASTSIGQEGLDFHIYCHKIYHWNLPSNPVDLEQREGRIHRYKGHAIRKNVAHKYEITRIYDLHDDRDPWDQIFARASRERNPKYNDMVPFWIFNTDDDKSGFKINRHVPALPLSRDQQKFHYLKKTLGAYRMVFGQPRQEDLLKYLSEHMGDKLKPEDIVELKVDLSPE